MFYQIAQEGPPTKYELSRLRSFETSGRFNTFLMEAADMATDIAFMLVLFDQAGKINLPEYMNSLYRETILHDNCHDDHALAPDTALKLAIASAFFLLVSVIIRATTSLVQIYRGREDLKGLGDYIYVGAGFIMSIVDPWNGSLFINQIIVHNRMDNTDYDLARNEFIADTLLIILEDLPQFIIQVLYGVYGGELERTTVAWFLAICSTSIHLATQLHEVGYLYYQLPNLKALQATETALE